MPSQARITVVGSGSWGTALAYLLAGNGHRVTMWCHHAQVAEAINRDHANPRYLRGVPLPPNLIASADLEASVRAARDMLLWVVPSHVTREVFARVVPHLPPDVPVISATKGIEVDTLKFMTDIFAELLGDGDGRLGVLSGPSFAQEVVAGSPTAVAVASTDERVGARVQALFASNTFRVYTNTDLVGTQLGGALKNVVAIAAGAVEGLGFGHNTQAVLITRGLAEIVRLGVAMGADPATLAGLAGMGDLVLTCTGGLSRNRQVGIALGQGRTLKEVLDRMHMVAEGVKTTAAAHQLARRMGVEMPIVAQIHKVLFEGETPRQAVATLMGRPQRSEEGLPD
ncbi:MAG: NAD(P)-dependent glycerol-3-phosphate dehydrogenase [Nitrospirae bacterium]|nr:NAD(P)-dependent glycerol-3-phosphate dehydrogenase [Nitrospirota bacterium]